jgi:hypothetical protein
LRFVPSLHKNKGGEGVSREQQDGTWTNNGILDGDGTLRDECLTRVSAR